jgi:hypothetical protein
MDTEDDVVRVLAGDTAAMISSREGKGCLGMDMLEGRLVGGGLAAIAVALERWTGTPVWSLPSPRRIWQSLHIHIFTRAH